MAWANASDVIDIFPILFVLFGWTFLLPVLFVLFSVLDAATWKQGKPSQFKTHFIVLFVLLIPLSILHGLTGSIYDAVWKQECHHRLKGLTLALHHYHEKHGSFPPAYTVSENGQPLHSWRVLLLPHLDEQELYDKIRLDEPWDSEYNRQFQGVQIAWYQCPASCRHFQFFTRNCHLLRMANCDYSVVIGEETIFPGSKAVRREEITDGTANTILIVERTTPVNWMNPNNEIQFDVACKGIDQHLFGIGSRHPFDWTLVGFADGRIQSLPPTTDIKPLLTKSAGD